MKTITVLTATRAEYGILKPLISKLVGCGKYKINIAVTGAHLLPEFGSTYKEIEADGFEIDEKIPILSGDDSPAGISKAMAAALSGFGDYFQRKHSDLLIVLGDRYETLAVACAAMNARIPIAHLHGGETTEGAIDEACRHAITKMSWLHFTSTEVYRKRVIQLGEDPKRVFNVGALGVENAMHIDFMTRDEIADSIDFPLDKPFAVVTFHPVTLENNSAAEQIQELLTVLAEHQEMNFIITGANADAGGRDINKAVGEYVDSHDNAIFVASLGMRRYLSSLNEAEMVVGNSSSGIVEVPSFGIPTINIGDRQKGRIQASSVINCQPTADSIREAFAKAKSDEFRKTAAETKSPYGDGKTSDRIMKHVEEALQEEIDLKKKFYDVDFVV